MNKKQLILAGVLIFVLAGVWGWYNQSSSLNNVISSKPARMGTSVAPMMEQRDSAGGAELADTMMVKPGMMPSPIEPDGGFTPGVERVVVKTANLGLLVADTRQTVEKITEVVKTNSGFVTSANIFERTELSGAVQAEMVIRVPVEKLEATMNQIKGLATKVTAETLNADDRTEQKIDLEAQLKNLKATEAQLLTIMKQANTVEETLRVQQELSQIRNQIERMQARLDNLTGDAAMSTLSVSISTKESDLPIVDKGKLSVWEEIKVAFKNTVIIYRELFIGVIRLGILVLPLLLVLALALPLIKKGKRK